MHVGQEIRRQREAKNWSQAKLGVLSGIGPSGISQIETGRRNPSAASLQGIAEALDVEVGELFPKAQSALPLETAVHDRMQDRLAPRVTRLEGLELSELSDRLSELTDQLADLKEPVPYKGGTKEEVRDWQAYEEATDEILALSVVLQQKASKQLV